MEFSEPTGTDLIPSWSKKASRQRTDVLTTITDHSALMFAALMIGHALHAARITFAAKVA
jgi:hypothetical protein